MSAQVRFTGETASTLCYSTLVRSLKETGKKRKSDQTQKREFDKRGVLFRKKKRQKKKQIRTHRTGMHGLVLQQTPLTSESRSTISVSAIKQLQSRHSVFFLNHLCVHHFQMLMQLYQCRFNVIIVTLLRPVHINKRFSRLCELYILRPPADGCANDVW